LQIMKLLIMHSPPLLCQLVPLRPKFLSEHSVNKDLQLMFLLIVRGVQKTKENIPSLARISY